MSFDDDLITILPTFTITMFHESQMYLPFLLIVLKQFIIIFQNLLKTRYINLMTHPPWFAEKAQRPGTLTLLVVLRLGMRLPWFDPGMTK